MISLDLFKRWVGPGLTAILIILFYQLFVSSTVNDLLADWQFLHAARMQVIQQQLQKAEQK